MGGPPGRHQSVTVTLLSTGSPQAHFDYTRDEVKMDRVVYEDGTVSGRAAWAALPHTNL